MVKVKMQKKVYSLRGYKQIVSDGGRVYAMKDDELLSSARKRADTLETMYENRADRYRKFSRLSLASSYVCYLAGAITVTSEPVSIRSVATSAVLIGGGAMLGKLKKELRFSEKNARLQADCEQNFIDNLEERITDMLRDPDEEAVNE